MAIHPQSSASAPTARLRWPRIWCESDATTRRTVLICALVAAIGFVIGISLDVRRAWGSFPFVVNLVSSITGASFGIVFALLVLQSLTARQAEAQSRREAERLYRRGLAELEHAARSIFHDPSGGDTASAIMDDLEAMDKNLPSFKKLVKLPGSPPGDRAYVHLLSNALDPVRESAQNIKRRISEIDRRRESWTNLQAQWRFFSDFVRGRVFGADIPWLSSDDFYRLQLAFGSSDESPVEVARKVPYLAFRYLTAAKDVASVEIDDGTFSQACQESVATLRSHIAACRQSMCEFAAALDVLGREQAESARR